MNIFNSLKSEVIHIVEMLCARGEIFEVPDMQKITVTPTKDLSLGDATTNVAMVLAKPLQMKSLKIARLLAPELQKLPIVEKIEISDLGFINLKFSNAFLYQQLDMVLKQGLNYGDSTIGNGIRVNVEFGSMDPIAPIHIGHIRGLVFGDTLSSLLQKTGYLVTREYYIHDMGTRTDKLALSVYLHYREAMGEDIGKISDDCYNGNYSKSIGQHIAKIDGGVHMSIPWITCREYFKSVACRMMMKTIKKDIGKLGIHFDFFCSEKEISESGEIKKTLKLLKKQNLVYDDIVPTPKSLKSSNDLKNQEMTFFKSTLFGDETDRPLKRSDGTYTYLLPDVTYQHNKHQRGFQKLVVILNENYAGNLIALQSAIKAITNNKANMECMLVRRAKFSNDDASLKPSRPSKEGICLSDLLKRTDKSVIRFSMLIMKNNSSLDFNLNKVQEKSKDNVVFYVQYACARAYSVVHRAEQMFGKNILNELYKADKSLLTEKAELKVMRLLALFPYRVEQASMAFDPCRIACYLRDLAFSFHVLLSKGRKNIQMRFLDVQNKELSKSSLALIQGVLTVLESGMKILGVVPAKEM